MNAKPSSRIPPPPASEKSAYSAVGSGSGTFYVTGGTVPFDAASYVTRQADRDLLEGLLQGEFCYVLNARQMGKSSLSVRTMRQLMARGVRPVFLDLTKIGGHNVTAEQWYLGLLAETGRLLGLRAQMVAYWKQNVDRSLAERYFGALREVALPAIAGDGGQAPDDRPADTSLPAIVVFIDEIDVTRSLPFSVDEFFAAIRALYNARVTDPLSGRIAFCLVGSALPSELIRDIRISPFNIGRRIELCDFTLEEAHFLARGLPGNARRLLRRIFYWTNGHPYLTQSICAEIARESASDSASVRTIYHGPRDVDRLVRRLFLDARARSRNVNLSDVSNRLLGHSSVAADARLEARAAALTLYRRVLKRRQRVDDDETDPLIGLLKLSGITRSERGRIIVRCRLYGHVFDDHWVDENMPDADLRRQRLAYRRGMLRAASVGSAVIACLAILTTWALVLNQQLTAQKRLMLNRFDRVDTAEGMRRLESGDAVGALAPLGEALRLAGEAGNQQRVDQHRIRLAAALSQAPHLLQLFYTGAEFAWSDVSPDGQRIVTADRSGTAIVWSAGTGRRLTPEMHHNMPLRFVSFSPDGNRIVTVADHYAQVWDSRTGRPITGKLTNEPGPGDLLNFTWRRAEWSRDGKLLSTADGNYAVVWDSRTGRRIYRAAMPRGGVNDAPFSPDATQIAVAAGACLSGLFKVQDPNWWHALGPCYEGNRAVYSRDGLHVLIAGSLGGGGEHRGAALVDVRTGKLSSPYFELGSSGEDAQFSPDEMRVVVGTAGHTVAVFDAHTGKQLTPTLKHLEPVVSVQFSADGTYILSASADGTACVWDSHTGERCGAGSLRHAGPILEAKFVSSEEIESGTFAGSRNSRPVRVLTTGADRTVRLWEIAPASSAGVGSQPGTLISWRHFSATLPALLGDNAVVTSSVDQGVQIERIPVGAESSGETPASGHILYPTPNVKQGFDPGGKGLLLWDSSDMPLVAVSGDPARISPLAPRLPDGWQITNQKRRISLSADGRIAAVSLRPSRSPIAATDTERPFAIDLERTGSTARPFPDGWHDGTDNVDERWRAFKPDSYDLLLSRSDPQPSSGEKSGSPGPPKSSPHPEPLRLWNCLSGEWRSPVMAIGDSLVSVAWGPVNSGKLLVSDASGRMYLFDTRTGQALVTTNLKVTESATPHWQDVRILQSRDHQTAFVFISTGQNLIWDLSAGRLLTSRGDGIQNENEVFLYPDASHRYLATNGQHHLLLYGSDGRAISGTRPVVHTASVTAVAFSADMSRFASASADSTARVWDARTGRPITPPLRHEDAVLSVAFSPNGRQVVTGCYDGTARVWDAATGEPLTAPLRHDHSVCAVWFTADGDSIVTVQARYNPGETAVRVWPLLVDHQKINALFWSTLLLSGETADTAGDFGNADPTSIIAAWRSLHPAN